MKYYKKNINYPRTLSSHFVDLWSDFDPMRWLHSASIYRRMQHLNTKSLLLVKYVSLLFLKFFFSKFICSRAAQHQDKYENPDIMSFENSIVSLARALHSLANF